MPPAQRDGDSIVSRLPATSPWRTTATYYALAYLGFAAPFLFTLAAPLAGYPVLLTASAGLALGTGGVVTRRSRRLDSCVQTA